MSWTTGLLTRYVFFSLVISSRDGVFDEVGQIVRGDQLFHAFARTNDDAATHADIGVDLRAGNTATELGRVAEGHSALRVCVVVPVEKKSVLTPYAGK